MGGRGRHDYNFCCQLCIHISLWGRMRGSQFPPHLPWRQHPRHWSIFWSFPSLLPPDGSSQGRFHRCCCCFYFDSQEPPLEDQDIMIEDPPGRKGTPMTDHKSLPPNPLLLLRLDTPSLPSSSSISSTNNYGEIGVRQGGVRGGYKNNKDEDRENSAGVLNFLSGGEMSFSSLLITYPLHPYSPGTYQKYQG